MLVWAIVIGLLLLALAMLLIVMGGFAQILNAIVQSIWAVEYKRVDQAVKQLAARLEPQVTAMMHDLADQHRLEVINARSVSEAYGLNMPITSGPTGFSGWVFTFAPQGVPAWFGWRFIVWQVRSRVDCDSPAPPFRQWRLAWQFFAETWIRTDAGYDSTVGTMQVELDDLSSLRGFLDRALDEYRKHFEDSQRYRASIRLEPE